MTEQATVVRVDGEFATVRIGRNSACASCGRCGMTDSQKYVDIYAANHVGAKVGDVVCVSLSEASATGLALVGYILPLVPALILMFVSLGLGWADWLSLVLFFVGYATGFCAVALVDKLKRHKWTKQAEIVEIVSGTETTVPDQTEVNDNESN